MEQEIEVISEDEKNIIAKIDGKPVKLFKINMEELEFKHTNDLFSAASIISPLNLNEGLKVTRKIIKDIPTVDKYEKISKYVTTIMNSIYFDLEPYNLSHLMHTMIKNTDPTIYGRAQTFMDQIKRFNGDLEKIKKFTDNS